MQESGRQKTRTHTQERRVGHPKKQKQIGCERAVGYKRPTHLSHKTRKMGHPPPNFLLGMTDRIAQRVDVAACSAKTSRAAYRPLSAAGKPA